MKKIIFSAMLLMLNLSNLSAQFDCRNIELLGIYDNNFDTKQLSILLTNKSIENDGNGDVYTSITLKNQNGDTLVYSGPVFSLPNSTSDTIVYNLGLHNVFSTIYELPSYYQGKLETQYPDCQIDFSFDSITNVVLPYTPNLDCSDFEIVGLYKTANGGVKNYSLLLTNTNQDSTRGWDAGYTSFQFFDENNQPLSMQSNPGYLVPGYQDTSIVHLEFFEELTPDQELQLIMTDPECQIDFIYGQTVNNTFEPTLPSLKIYPNPTIDWLVAECDENVEIIEIMDFSGETLLSSRTNMINLSEISTGIYLLRLQAKNGVYLEKIIKY